MTEPSPPPPSSRLPRVSLQAQILAVVLLCVALPILLTGAFFLEHNHALLSERGRERLSNSAFRKATEIDEWARQRQEEAQRWAASFVVFEGLEVLARGEGDTARVKTELNDFLAALLPHHRAYESLLIVDLRGRVLASTREERVSSFLLRLAENPPGSRTVFSPLQAPGEPGRPGWMVVQPVRGRSDQSLGYVVGRLDLREVEGLLVAEPDGLAFWLLDAEGRIQARAGRMADSAAQDFFPASLQQAAEPTRAVHEGTLPGLGPALFSLRSLEGPFRASVVATLPSSAAYRPLVEARNRVLRWGLGGTAVVMLLAFFAARRVLRPIPLLSHAAAQVSAGEMDVQLPVYGRNELSDLTLAFNEMAKRIREARARLEETRDDLANANRELTDANRTLETLAITDGLTGLFNRRHFQEMLEREIARCQRMAKPLSLLMCDLDHFKAYNDRWGHQEGDAALRRVASALLNTIRNTDMAFRYGGEELAVLLPHCTKEQAAQVAEKLRVAVSGRQEQRPLRFRTQYTTVSIGVACFPEDARVARGLVDVADAALYEAKAQGRDCVVVAGEGTAPEPEPQESAG